MDEKEASIYKIFAELGINNEPKLSPEQESLLKAALDPEEQFVQDVKRIFKVDKQ